MHDAIPVPLPRSAVSTAAATLARAFETGPFSSWMVPVQEQRAAAFEEYFADKLDGVLDDAASVVLTTGSGTSFSSQRGCRDGDQAIGLSDRAREGRVLAETWVRSTDRADVRLDSSNPSNLTFYHRPVFVADAPVLLPHRAGALTPMRLRHAETGGAGVAAT